MKRMVIAVLFICLFVGMLAGCSSGGEPEGSDGSAPKAGEQGDTRQSEGMAEAANLLELAEGPVPDFLDEAQQVLYRRAKTAFKEFTLDNTGFGSGGGGPADLEMNAMTYWKCTGTLTRWSDFEAAMLSLFTADYFEELNAGASYTDGDGLYHRRTIFAERDGDLYFSGGARGGHVTFVGPETFELIVSSEDEIRFYVVGTYDDFAHDENGDLIPDEAGDYLRAGDPISEKKTLVMVLTSGGWRFSEFQLAC